MTVPVTYAGATKNDLEPDRPPEDLSEIIDFSSYDLRTTIRLIVSSGENRRVEVRRGSKRGAIFIRGGEIYRVVADQSQGDEAMFEILSWDKASHSDSRNEDVEERNVRIPTEVFLDLMEKQNP